MPVLLAGAGFLLVGLDGSLNIAFPAMAAAFDVGPTTIRWVIICYVGTYSLTAFAAGVLADRLGAGRVVRAGLLLSLLCFLAFAIVPSFAALLVVRVLQGVSGGLIYGAAPALVTLALPPSRHGWGLGWASFGLGVGLGLSPLVGGFLVEAFGWKGVFLYRVPVAAAVFLSFNGRLVYKYGASAASGLQVRPNNLLFWHVIRWAVEHGYRTLDFGRTDLGQ